MNRIPIPARCAFILAAALAAAGCAAGERAGGRPVRAVFRCEGGRSIEAAFSAAPDSVKLKLSDGRVLTLPRAISADGARYASEDESLVFWNRGSTAFITENGAGTYNGCAESAD